MQITSMFILIANIIFVLTLSFDCNKTIHGSVSCRRPDFVIGQDSTDIYDDEAVGNIETHSADAMNFTFYFDIATNLAKQTGTTDPECDNVTLTYRQMHGLQIGYCSDIRPRTPELFNTTYIALLIIAGSSVMLLTIVGNLDENDNVSTAETADINWDIIRNNFDLCTEVLSYCDIDIENNTVKEEEVHEFDWDQLSMVAKKCKNVSELEDKVTSVDITKKLNIDPVRNIGYFGHCDDVVTIPTCTDAILKSYLNDDYNVDYDNNRYFVLKPAAMAGGDLTYFFKYDKTLNKYQFEDNYLLDYMIKGLHINVDKYNRQISLTAEEQQFKNVLLKFHDFESLKTIIDGNQSMTILHDLGAKAGSLMQEKKYQDAKNVINLKEDQTSGCFLKYISLAASRYVISGLRHNPSRNECMIVQPRFMAKPFGENEVDEIYEINNDKPFELNVLSVYGKTIAAQWNVPKKEDYKTLVKQLLPELEKKTDILAKYSKFPMWRSDYFIGKVNGKIIIKYNEGESLSGKEFLKFEGNRSICLDREIASNVKKGILQFIKAKKQLDSK